MNNSGLITEPSFHVGERVKVRIFHFSVGRTYNFADHVEGEILSYDPKGMYWLRCKVGSNRFTGWAYQEDVSHGDQ